jgi:hypothetical protein
MRDVRGRGLGTHLAVLLVVADEVPKLLLAALQRGVQLLHLAHQVRLFALQALPVGFHGCGQKSRLAPRARLVGKQGPEDEVSPRSP